MSIDTMKQALEALEYIENNYMSLPAPAIKAIDALRLAIEQAERQEPVACQGVHDKTDLYYRKPVQGDVRPLYTTPPAAQRQPLTDEEIGLLTTGDGWSHCHNHALALFARAIERKHGIGGGE
jgi:hypothetical protein